MTLEIVRYFESIEQRISALEKAAGIAAEKATDKPAAPAPAEKATDKPAAPAPAEKPSKAAEGAMQPAKAKKSRSPAETEQAALAEMKEAERAAEAKKATTPAPKPAEEPAPAEEQKAERGDAPTEADRSKLRTRLAALLHSQNTGAADRARAKIRGGELKRASDVETWEEFDAFESFLDEEGF